MGSFNIVRIENIVVIYILIKIKLLNIVFTNDVNINTKHT